MVADDGPGVTAAHADQMFDAYWRERRHERGEFLGVGLGLSISRIIAEAMNGSLEYHRRDDWTLLTLRLPAADRPLTERAAA